MVDAREPVGLDGPTDGPTATGARDRPRDGAGTGAYQASRGSERTVALVTFGVGLLALVVLAVILVPWHPVPGGRPPAAAQSRYFTAAQTERADQFSRWARAWSWSALGLRLLVGAGLGFSGRLRSRVVATRGPWWLRVPATVAIVTVVVTVVGLPSACALAQLERRHGLSTESWTGFAQDQAVAVAISILTTALALVVVLACMRRWRRAWPAIVAGLVAAFVVLGSFAYPVVVEPLSTHLTPLPAGPLRTEILALAATEGVHLDDVSVADASRRTTTLNAYVSGFGRTRRVVLYDTTVRDLPDREIDAVVAHELGHAANDDVLHGTLLGAAGGVLAVGLLALVLDLLRRRRAWPGAGQVHVVPVVLALVALGTFVCDPVVDLVSRDIETRADLASLRTTHDPAAFIGLQQRLALSAQQDPSPPALSQWWFGTHPTPLQRIALATDPDVDK